MKEEKYLYGANYKYITNEIIINKFLIVEDLSNTNDKKYVIETWNCKSKEECLKEYGTLINRELIDIRLSYVDKVREYKFDVAYSLNKQKAIELVKESIKNSIEEKRKELKELEEDLNNINIIE